MSETEANEPGTELVGNATPAAFPAPTPDALQPDYTDAGVPSFDYVRDRIENRFTTATGATELAGLGTDQDVASLDEKLAERDRAARAKLDEIRKSMRRE
jgi:phage shock protein A